MFEVPTLTGPRPLGGAASTRVRIADDTDTARYREIRREVFVAEQGLFSGTDRDEFDDDPRTVVLVVLDERGEVAGGVRLGPAECDGPDIGWWTGSRLAVRRGDRRATGVGSALIREACGTAVARGALRFEALVQVGHESLFERLGWVRWGTRTVQGAPHVKMRWPIDRLGAQLRATKGPLADVLADLRHDHAAGLGGTGFVGDDGAPVPGSDVIAVCDAILPGMVERDPEWAGWCGVLVNANDLAAMGAAPSGLMDAVAAPTASFARRVVNGIRSASEAWGIPVLGGHTQLGVPPALTVTAFGRAARPVPGGGGRAGHEVRLSVDLAGGWRRGYEGRQWDSTSARSAADLRRQNALVAVSHPAAAKDVSMAGILGSIAMMAEASGTGAVIDAARIPCPAGASYGDWLTCFPGFGMVTADAPDRPGFDGGHVVTTASVGTLSAATGTRLRWPDGEETVVSTGGATGLGAAA